MKVSDLFEAVQGEPGQGGRLSSGAYYSPKYDAEKNWLRGSVIDWYNKMGVKPEHIEQAIAHIKQTPLFKSAFPQAGLEYEYRPASEKRGTLTFKVKRTLPNGKTYQTSYKIYGNGQIRWASERGWGAGGEYTSPLKSPKPRMKAGDPVGSLINIYTDSMEELLSKWKKSAAKMDKDASKEVK